jgi:hypothetical protein
MRPGHDRKKKKETTLPGQLLTVHFPFLPIKSPGLDRKKKKGWRQHTLDNCSPSVCHSSPIFAEVMSHKMSFPCRFCGQTFKTSKGRSNHLSQFKSCHVQLLKSSESRPQVKRRRKNSNDADPACLDAESDSANHYNNPMDDQSSEIMDFDPPISVGPREPSATPDDRPETEPPSQEKSQQQSR